MAKKRLKDEHIRNKRIPVRVSQRELEVIQLVADLHKLSVSQYVRKRLIPLKEKSE